MWLGEQISERGIGNGISLIIFAGIVVDFPRGLNSVISGLRTGSMDPLRLIFLGVMMLAVIGFIVFVERGQRRIPVSYAKRVVGRKVYGGQSTHLPLRVNTGGVIPIIFAASIITIPSTLAQLVKVPVFQTIASQFSLGMPLYNLVYIAAIIFFTYFYVSIIFNPVDVAENLRKYGGFIPGIRPGKNTSDHIDDILSRITLVGAIYLAAIAILPEFLTDRVQGPGPAVHRRPSSRPTCPSGSPRACRSTSTSAGRPSSSSSASRWTPSSRSRPSSSCGTTTASCGGAGSRGEGDEDHPPRPARGRQRDPGRPDREALRLPEDLHRGPSPPGRPGRDAPRAARPKRR